MTLNVPNLLTSFRLLTAILLPFVVLFFKNPHSDWIALFLFLFAAITDFLDGYWARKYGLTSLFGAMLDSIADKILVLVFLFMINEQAGGNPWISLPVYFILIRELVVSGLRDFLGDDKDRLTVTMLAKWKTAVQMVAIFVLLLQALFYHYLVMETYGMSPQIIQDILSGAIEDTIGITWKYYGSLGSFYGGIGLLWFSTLLAIVTGIDYFKKALPLFKERR